MILRSNPPIEKHHPRVGGAIAWSRSLFFRIKATIIKFKSFPDMLANEQGRIVTKKYLTVAKSMREHDEQVIITFLLLTHVVI
jgi:dynein heavy chain